MEATLSEGEAGLMGGPNQDGAGLHWFPWQQQEQQQAAATRGRHGGASSVHPLIPLLHYSDRRFPPSSPYDRPIGAASGPPQADAHSVMYPCCHSNTVTSGGDGGGGGGVQLVKKPLNAFMLYMKEMRHKVQQEGRERESAAINRILGRRWHALSHSEQSKYYDLAQKERLLHMQLYPGWSARDNYGKRKRRRSQKPTGSCSSWTLAG